MKQLKGMKCLDLLIAPHPFDSDRTIMQILRDFQMGLRVLDGSRLQSARLAIEITVNSDAATASKISKRLEAGSDTILQWLHDMEAYRLRPDGDSSAMVKMLNLYQDEWEAALVSHEAQ